MKKLMKLVLLLITMVNITTSNAQNLQSDENTLFAINDSTSIQQIKVDTRTCPTLDEILEVNKTIEIWDLFPDETKIIMAKGPHKDMQGFFIKRGNRWCILDIEKSLNPVGVVVEHSTEPPTIMLEYKNKDGLSHYKKLKKEQVVEEWFHIGKL